MSCSRAQHSDDGEAQPLDLKTSTVLLSPHFLEDDSHENSSLILYKIQDGCHKFVCTAGVIGILKTKVSSNKLVEGKL